MWGRGADASRFSSLAHLVLIMELREGLGELEAHKAIQNAEFTVACKLAETTEGLAPARNGVYEVNGGARRPRVVLIQGCITQGQQPTPGSATMACRSASRCRPRFIPTNFSTAR